MAIANANYAECVTQKPKAEPIEGIVSAWRLSDGVIALQPYVGSAVFQIGKLIAQAKELKQQFATLTEMLGIGLLPRRGKQTQGKVLKEKGEISESILIPAQVLIS